MASMAHGMPGSMHQGMGSMTQPGMPNSMSPCLPNNLPQGMPCNMSPGMPPCSMPHMPGNIPPQNHIPAMGQQGPMHPRMSPSMSGVSPGMSPGMQGHSPGMPPQQAMGNPGPPPPMSHGMGPMMNTDPFYSSPFSMYSNRRHAPYMGQPDYRIYELNKRLQQRTEVRHICLFYSLHVIAIQ